MSYNELENNFFIQELNFIDLYKKGVDPLLAFMRAFNVDDVEYAKKLLATMNMEEKTSAAYIEKLKQTITFIKENVVKEEPKLRR